MKQLVLVLVLTLIGMIGNDLYAQCAMCKAVVESSSNTGSEIAQGVNSAILYLMGIPYLMVFVVGIAWYKKYYKTEEK